MIIPSFLNDCQGKNLMKKKKNNYISNKELYLHMKMHREALLKTRNGELKPRISNYVGQAIFLICNNLAKKPNFIGYTYKGDMISDAIVDCVAAVDNFDPEKTNNPFAYFTQIAWNAYIRRIHKEKKQTYIKHKNFQNTFNDYEGEDVIQLKTNDHINQFIKDFEENLTKAKKQAKVSGVEQLVKDKVEEKNE